MNALVRLRLGTRASPLARWQADWVARELEQRGVQVVLVPMSTRGDQERGGPIGAIGGQGVFTKELQRALLADEIDLAVHSLKDLPTEAVEGLILAAVPERGPAGDVLVSREGQAFDDLPLRARIGTDSLRRRAQLLHKRPDLEMRSIRGNVDTRIKKLDHGQYDALVLARAGLERLGLAARITQQLPLSLMLPAVGQGALAIEARTDDQRTIELLLLLDHPGSHRAVLAERAMLAALRGGCLAPVGAWGRVEHAGQLRLRGVVLGIDGSRRLFVEETGDFDRPSELGRLVAEKLLSQGAGDLIAAARGRDHVV